MGAAGVVRTAAALERTQATRLYAESPLRLLHATSLQPAAWIYQTHLGGGFVSGDEVALEVEVGDGATTVLGTQASTKVYRGAARQTLTARVADAALLALLAEPVVCFGGASYTQRMRIALQPTASVVMLDWLTCGRAACGEQWAFSRYDSRLTLTRAGTALIDERTLLEGDDLADRMQRFLVLGWLWWCGPRAPALDVEKLGTRSPHLHLAVSEVAPDVLALRFAAANVEAARQALRPVLQTLTPLLGSDPWARQY